MSKMLPETRDASGDESPWMESKEIPGLLFSKNPIRDFDEFMRSLPDFGEDGVRLHEVIMEERAIRRALAAEKSDNGEC